MEDETAWVITAMRDGKVLLDADNKPIQYISPLGYQAVKLASGGILIPPFAVWGKWEPYTGSLGVPSQECAAPVPVPEGDPYWVLGELAFKPAGFNKGAYFEQDVLFSALVAATGQQITRIELKNGPVWLSITNYPDQKKATLKGNVPEGFADQITYQLVGVQGNERSATKNFTHQALLAGVYLRLSYNKDTATLSAFVGAKGTANPVVQIVSGYAGYADREQHLASSITATTLQEKAYYYRQDYPNAVTGIVDLKITHLGQTYYTRYEVAEGINDPGTDMPLLAQAPALPDDFIVLEGGEPVNTTPSLDQVAYSWRKNNPAAGQMSDLTVYWKAGNGTFEMAFEVVGQLPKSAYAQGNASATAGYTHLINTYNAPAGFTYRFYLRLVGSTDDVLVREVTIPAGSGNIALTPL